MEFFSSKQNVPEFIMKIYYILEKNEFQDVICWSSNSLEIQIKNSKDLEDKVLPLYFRHKKIQSFIRQLNMYRFNKVNKLNKQKNHVFFKNELFRKGQIENLSQIKRKKKGQHQQNNDSFLEGQTQNLLNYKEFIKTTITQIQLRLKKIKKSHPYLFSQLSKIHRFCNILTGDDSQINSFLSSNEINNDMFKTFQNLASSIKNFGSVCSIQIKQEQC